jgi:hypothetical protein
MVVKIDCRQQLWACAWLKLAFFIAGFSLLAAFKRAFILNTIGLCFQKCGRTLVGGSVVFTL